MPWGTRSWLAHKLAAGSLSASISRANRVCEMTTAWTVK